MYTQNYQRLTISQTEQPEAMLYATLYSQKWYEMFSLSIYVLLEKLYPSPNEVNVGSRKGNPYFVLLLGIPYLTFLYILFNRQIFPDNLVTIFLFHSIDNSSLRHIIFNLIRLLINISHWTFIIWCLNSWRIFITLKYNINKYEIRNMMCSIKIQTKSVYVIECIFWCQCSLWGEFLP